MRTTLDVDDDVLQAAEEMAANEGTSVGRVLSDLARKALSATDRKSERNGVPLIAHRPKGSSRPTMESVNRLRDVSDE